MSVTHKMGIYTWAAAYFFQAAGGIVGCAFCEGKNVALLGFVMYTIDGIFGLLAYIITKNPEMRDVYRIYIHILQEICSHAFITTEYCISDEMSTPIAFVLNFLFPSIFLIDFYIFGNMELEILDAVGHGISCIAMAFVGFDKREYMAYIVSALYLFLHFALDPTYVEHYAMTGFTSVLAGMLLSGNDFSSIFNKSSDD